jgi:phosphatidylserine decarboxylase
MGKGERIREERKVKNEQIAAAQKEIQNGLNEIQEVQRGLTTLTTRNGDFIFAIIGLLIEKGIVTENELKDKVEAIKQKRNQDIKKHFEKLEINKGEKEDAKE